MEVKMRRSEASRMGRQHIQTPPGREIRAAKRGLSRRLLQNPGVSGVGIEAVGGVERIKVYLAEESAPLRSLVPAEIDGFPVVIEIIGAIAAHAATGPRGHGAVA
jgi:hypothetical protein